MSDDRTIEFHAKSPNGWGGAIFLGAEYLKARAAIGDTVETRRMLDGLGEKEKMMVRLGALMGGIVVGVEIAPFAARVEEPEAELAAAAPAVGGIVMVLDERAGRLFERARCVCGADAVTTWSKRSPGLRAVLERALAAIPP